MPDEKILSKPGMDMKTFDYMKLADRMRDSEILTYVAKFHEYMGRQELYIWQKTVELGRLAVFARIKVRKAPIKFGLLP